MIDRKHAGGRNELMACVWLLQHGYEVFRNVSDHGYVDLVAMKGKEVLFLDVKGSNSENHRPRLHRRQIDRGISAIYVLANGNCIINTNPDVKPTTVEFNCANCGKLCVTNRSRQKYCSHTCYDNVQYSKRKEYQEIRIAKNRAAVLATIQS